MAHMPEISQETYKKILAVTSERTPLEDNYQYEEYHPWHIRTYGGNPIPIRMQPGECFSHTRLFLGESQVQLGEIDRPQVDSIVNLCELDDIWPLKESDFRWPRGEGIFGYTWERLYEDTEEVVEQVRQGKVFLIHCMAGVNRSVTLTCSTLMRIEGISALDALLRVRRFRAAAHPEMRHWLVLRQLEIVYRAEAAEKGTI